MLRESIQCDCTTLSLSKFPNQSYGLYIWISRLSSDDLLTYATREILMHAWCGTARNRNRLLLWKSGNLRLASSQDGSVVIWATIGSWGYGLQDSAVNAAPSVSTANQRLATSCMLCRLSAFISSESVWKHKCAESLWKPLIVQFSLQECLFSSLIVEDESTQALCICSQLKLKDVSPLLPLLRRKLGYSRGELWNKEVQTPKRMCFWMTKALKAKTISIWSVP